MATFEDTSVVITGLGAVSPYGNGVDPLWNGLLENKNCVRRVAELEQLPMVKTKVAATVPEMDFSFIPRRNRRSMSKMACYAYVAAREALAQAGYKEAPENLGFFMGSTLNSISVWMNIVSSCNEGHLELVKTSDFLQIMNHSPLATAAQALGINGPSLGASDACATGLYNVALGYLAIKSGLVSQALCGGTEEYHPLFSACFDIMQAASFHSNDCPEKSSAPFDKNRSGLVVAEGCGLLFLESEQSARARGATILARVLSVAANTETENMAYPSEVMIEKCMRRAMERADLSPENVDLVNAHATGTIVGDIAESKAVEKMFGPTARVNSLKGHLGHTMGASGALELIACVKMLETGEVIPVKNLQTVDDRCGALQYVTQLQRHPLS
ncbi:MAG: beta-ketoacyl-[acyl-carrier-protein] synthase family protein, partial [Elusimicrobiaceae bacterium]|nr:beta-ketoacyl-[acyl-carrier-protein] synthase family protein [Elusimicrobiaceae bacterium]